MVDPGTLSSVLSVLTEMVARFRPDSGEITYTNRAFAEFRGQSPEALIGSSIFDHLGRESDTDRRALVDGVTAGQPPKVLDLEVPDAEGAERWIAWTLCPVDDGEGGRPAEVQLSGHDISSRKRTERALSKALSEVEALTGKLAHETTYYREQQVGKADDSAILGEGQATRLLREGIATVAPTDATVLIEGETGTGKELVAQAIHRQSARAKAPLIRLNCAALSANLIESELFGHERGAFTGATTRRQGRFELADSGTLFLDEIGELPMELQPKLLRALQEGEFERVGSSKPIRVDVRVVAATNRDLESEVKKGNFRSDLFFRLRVFPLRTPPLRERGDDIGLLAKTFLMRSGARVGRDIRDISPEALAWLQSYSWPGNVRELQNTIERATIVAKGQRLELADLVRERQFGEADAAPPSTSGKQTSTWPELTFDEMARRHIEETLTRCDGRIEGAGGAADKLGLKPSTLRARMGKLGIRR